jgi:hypothetical protein
MTKVSYYKKSNNPYIYADVDLNQVLFVNKEKRQRIDYVRENLTDTNKQRLKQEYLTTFTPSGTFAPSRQASNLSNYNGLMQFDIDGKDNPTLTPQEMKEKIINSDLKDYIYYMGLSCSGKGIWGLIRINGNKDDFKAHFEAFQEDLKSIGIIGDSACGNIALQRYISYDDNAYFNPQSEIYCKLIERADEPCKPRKGQANGLFEQHIATDKETEIMDNMIKGIEHHHYILTNNHGDSQKIISALVNTFGQSGLQYWLTIRMQRTPYDKDKQEKAYQATLSKYQQGGYIGNYGLNYIVSRYKQAKGVKYE